MLMAEFPRVLVPGEPPGGKQAPCDLKAGLRMTLPGIFAVNSALNGGAPQKIYYPWDSEWKDFSLEGNKLTKKEK